MRYDDLITVYMSAEKSGRDDKNRTRGQCLLGYVLEVAVRELG